MYFPVCLAFSMLARLRVCWLCSADLSRRTVTSWRTNIVQFCCVNMLLYTVTHQHCVSCLDRHLSAFAVIAFVFFGQISWDGHAESSLYNPLRFPHVHEYHQAVSSPLSPPPGLSWDTLPLLALLSVRHPPSQNTRRVCSGSTRHIPRLSYLCASVSCFWQSAWRFTGMQLLLR